MIKQSPALDAYNQEKTHTIKKSLSRVLLTRGNAQAEDLAIPVLELPLQFGHHAHFRGVDRIEAVRVGKYHAPSAINVLVKVQLPNLGLTYEIRN